MAKEEKRENETQEKKDEEKDEKSVEKKEIEKIKSDVDKLSQDLKTAVSELKKSIVDIRSAVSEIENPFNLLRAISSEKDLKKLNHERLPPGVKSLVLGKNEEEVAEEKVEEKPITPPSISEEKTLETKPISEEQPPSRLESPRAGTIYLDWVWSLLDLGFTSDDVKQLAQSYERLGFLPKNSSEQAYSLAVAAEKAKSKGLSKGKLLLNMYKASIASGIEIRLDDAKMLISIAEGSVKKARRVA
ncbi:MAG: hypothetical protein QXI91_03870 [Candidatus Bathyarchaeia archaeon]